MLRVFRVDFKRLYPFVWRDKDPFLKYGHMLSKYLNITSMYIEAMQSTHFKAADLRIHNISIKPARISVEQLLVHSAVAPSTCLQGCVGCLKITASRDLFSNIAQP